MERSKQGKIRDPQPTVLKDSKDFGEVTILR